MSNAQNAAIDAALSKVITAIDQTSLAKSCFHDLGYLFRAINKLSDDQRLVCNLAKIGQYLADDWGNLNDCACGDLEDEEKALRALKQVVA